MENCHFLVTGLIVCGALCGDMCRVVVCIRDSDKYSSQRRSVGDEGYKGYLAART